LIRNGNDGLFDGGIASATGFTIVIPDEVVIRLSEVGGKAASFQHDLRQQFHAFGV